MWKLVIEDDEGKRTIVPLTRDDYTIGRQEGNTIRLTERNVSRQHAKVRRAGDDGKSGGFLLEDRSSYNGVFVNGLRVAHSQELLHGDLIQIGDYRVVLQDDAASAVDTIVPIDDVESNKATIPMASAFRGQTLTERPSRFVMLVGPTPGMEYPLDRERLTIGRAEDATISVNHNSVSRLHCEVHALGDGRYEIVDKGSSNGVRVNAAELKRSIIEAGDLIELGDVRFKFVGAGQVFVPGPNESQQLTAISDRDMELAERRRGGLAGYFVPIMLAGVVGAAMILGLVWYLRGRADGDATLVPVATPTISASDADATLVADAKKNCTPDDCEKSHALVTQLPDTSPSKSSPDAQLVESMWADALLRKARAEGDTTAKKALLQRVSGTGTVDATRRAQANDLLAALDTPPPGTAPVPPPSEPATTSVATPSPPPTPRPIPTSHPAPTIPQPTSVPPAPTSSATATTPHPASSSNLEKAQKAALDGQYGVVRSLLEGKVRGGHGTTDEARLVREACRLTGDRACADDVKSKYPALSGGT